jgi:hypothetical protein
MSAMRTPQACAGISFVVSDCRAAGKISLRPAHSRYFFFSAIEQEYFVVAGRMNTRVF